MERIVRKIDKLGRIVLPIDLRKAIGVSIYDEVVLCADSCCIMIKKESRECYICKKKISNGTDAPICSCCMQKFARVMDDNS